MYVAMNRFAVAAGQEQAFEALWLERNSQLDDLEGFEAFHMLKGTTAADGTRLYISSSTWASEAAFRAWTRSEAFRAAHKDVGAHAELYQGPPVFEGFDVIQTL
ncbi:MAG: antibiotic biosynthesis monooxygenase [Pseudomonadota bacterium]